MALQPLPLARDLGGVGGRLVMRQRDRAVLAFQLRPTRAADHRRRIAAPVQQNQRLLSAVQRRLGLLDQRARKQVLVPGLPEFPPHIHQLHLGQRPVHHPHADRDPRVLPLCRVLPALQRRRGRPQHHHRIGQLGAHHSHVARVVARRLFLLVALIVFLIHQDQAQVRQPAQRSPNACPPRWAPRPAESAATARCAPPA